MKAIPFSDIQEPFCPTHCQKTLTSFSEESQFLPSPSPDRIQPMAIQGPGDAAQRSDLERLEFGRVAHTDTSGLFGLQCSVPPSPGEDLWTLAALLTDEGPTQDLDVLISRLVDIPRRPVIFLPVPVNALSGEARLLTAIDEAADAAGLIPERIVLELSDLRAPIDSVLLNVVDEVRALGFQLSLSGRSQTISGFKSIFEMRPDYLHTGPFFIHGSEGDFFQQSILDALAELAWKFGAFLIADGVENSADLALASKLGAPFMTGTLAGPRISMQQLSSLVPTELTDSVTKWSAQSVLSSFTNRDSSRHSSGKDRRNHG